MKHGILTLNAGSSSLKFAVFALDEGADEPLRVLRGQVAGIGSSPRIKAWNARGEPVRLSGTVLDITARRAMEEEKRELERQMQHAQKLDGAVEALLKQVGFTLVPVRDAHLCCGSAGTYSILQADISKQLLERKLRALKADHPDLVVTANIGCLLHLDSADPLPVIHWLNLLADDLSD